MADRSDEEHDTSEPEYGTPTPDNPEWTAEHMRKALRLDQLPAHVQAAACRGKDRSRQQDATGKVR